MGDDRSARSGVRWHRALNGEPASLVVRLGLPTYEIRFGRGERPSSSELHPGLPGTVGSYRRLPFGVTVISGRERPRR